MKLPGRRYGNVAWDGVVFGTGVIGLLAIPAVLFTPLAVGGLIGFLVVTIWVNGPVGLLLPATYEPILMVFGRLYPPVLIALIGIAGVLYVEVLNYCMYRRVLQFDALRTVRESRVTSFTMRLFERAPFFTVWLCSWSPLPYWVARILASMAGYSLRRYLVASLLGRGPRLWFFAALGTYWDVSVRTLSLITVSSILLGLTIWTVKVLRSRAIPAYAALPVPRD